MSPDHGVYKQTRPDKSRWVGVRCGVDAYQIKLAPEECRAFAADLLAAADWADASAVSNAYHLEIQWQNDPYSGTS